MPKKRKSKRPFFRRGNNSRDWSNPAYAKFRKEVRKRDDYQCQFPGCSNKTKLEVHHIKQWAHFPGMRFEATKGITLCKSCHNITKGNEEVYEGLFFKVLEWNALQRLKRKEEEDE